MDKLKVYSDFLDSSITQYENSFKEDYAKFKEAGSKIEPFSYGGGVLSVNNDDNLERKKVADGFNETATASMITLEALKEGRDKLYELFPEVKAYSESKRVKDEVGGKK